MTNKEYLRQAYRLDQIINSNLEEVTHLRKMVSGISAPSLTEKVQTSASCEALFVRNIEKITLLEDRINGEIDTLIDLREQIRGVIESVPDRDERMVLRYRYIHNLTWKQIGEKLNADARTIRRWHSDALAHMVLPTNPIAI